MIAAVLIGPILAVQIQKLIERKTERTARKKQIFSTLMATRATPLDQAHVQALNRIDIDFYDDQKVKEAWKALLDNFEHFPTNPGEPEYSIRLTSCTDKAKELLTNLLYEMSCSLGYKYDKVHLARKVYYPKGHGDLEAENYQMRQAFLKILSDKASLPVKIINEKQN